MNEITTPAVNSVSNNPRVIILCTLHANYSLISFKHLSFIFSLTIFSNTGLSQWYSYLIQWYRYNDTDIFSHFQNTTFSCLLYTGFFSAKFAIHMYYQVFNYYTKSGDRFFLIFFLFAFPASLLVSDSCSSNCWKDLPLVCSNIWYTSIITNLCWNNLCWTNFTAEYTL